MTVSVLCLLLTVPFVGLQCVIVLFPDYTSFFFQKCFRQEIWSRPDGQSNIITFFFLYMPITKRLNFHYQFKYKY